LRQEKNIYVQVKDFKANINGKANLFLVFCEFQILSESQQSPMAE
jgi:hypothetical protein